METRHKEAAAEAAWPRTGDDHGNEGRGMKFVNFCREMRAAKVGDKMGEELWDTTSEAAGAVLIACDGASSTGSEAQESLNLYSCQRDGQKAKKT